MRYIFLVLSHTNLDFKRGALIIGFPVIVDTNQSLQEIIDQGIAPFVQEISQVGENAMNELNIEIGLDRMEFATTGYSMELDKDEGTGN